jgi:hypothetical protein
MTAGEEIIEGLKEFRDALRRGEKIENRFTVRTVEGWTSIAMAARFVQVIRRKDAKGAKKEDRGG